MYIKERVNNAKPRTLEGLKLTVIAETIGIFRQMLKIIIDMYQDFFELRELYFIFMVLINFTEDTKRQK